MAAVDLHRLLLYQSPALCQRVARLTSNPAVAADLIQRALQEPQVGRSATLTNAQMTSMLSAVSSWLRVTATYWINAQTGGEPQFPESRWFARTELFAARVSSVSGLKSAFVWSRLEEMSTLTPDGDPTQGSEVIERQGESHWQFSMDCMTVFNQIADEVDAWRIGGPPWWP